MAVSLSGCGGGGGTAADQQQAQLTSFTAPVTASNVAAIVDQDFRFSGGIQAFDEASKQAFSLPPTTLTVSRSTTSPTGYAFKMALEDGSNHEISGEFGFGSCLFKVTKTTATKKPLTEGETVEIKACEIGLNGQYAVTDQKEFEAELMAKLGSSKTDVVRTPVKILIKEDKGTVVINGQNVGDTRLEFVTGSGG